MFKPKEALKQSNPKRIILLMLLGVKVDFLSQTERTCLIWRKAHLGKVLISSFLTQYIL